MAYHKNLTGNNVHKAYAWSYANATAREAASGMTSANLGDLALQEDNNTLWILTATTPTWQQVDYIAVVGTAQTITAVHTFNPASGANAILLGVNATVPFARVASDSHSDLLGGTSITDGAAILLYGGTHSSTPGNMYLRIGGANDVGNIIFQYYDGASNHPFAILDRNANLTIGTNSSPATGTNTLSVQNGTAPAIISNCAQIYAADISAGNSAIHCQCEGGAVIKLFQGAVLSSQLTTITHTEPGTPDYAIAALTNSSPYGFASQDEGHSVLKVIANLQTRLDELEDRLQAHGLLAA